MNDEDLLQGRLPKGNSQTYIRGPVQVWSTKPLLEVTQRCGEPAKMAHQVGALV